MIDMQVHAPALINARVLGHTPKDRYVTDMYVLCTAHNMPPPAAWSSQMNGAERLQNTVVVGCGEYNERCCVIMESGEGCLVQAYGGLQGVGSTGRENTGKGEEERGSREFQRSAGVEAARKSRVVAWQEMKL